MRVAPVLALLLLVVGCSDDDDGTTAVPAPADEAGGFIRYERSFGFCAGFCQQLVGFDGAEVTLVARDRETGLEVTRSGRLTADGQEKVRTVATSLDGAALEKIYGCPDCTDGGATTVVLAGDPEATSTYDATQPPPILEAIDSVGGAVMDALATCQSSELVEVADDCQPLRP